MHRSIIRLSLLFFLVLYLLTSCYRMRHSEGGGQNASFKPPRTTNPADILLPVGYKIEAIASGLTFPTSVVFDEAGRMYVLEAGYSYGEVFASPRLLEVDAKGKTLRTVVEGVKNGPWTGVAYKDGYFYIAEGGEMEGGRILKVSKDGKKTLLIEDLPSVGDHHTNGPVIGNDGYLYFGQGTATNSAVVGPDNAQFGWLYRRKDFHDIPCKDITLSGQNFESDNPLDKDSKNKVKTGAYSPFGTETKSGQLIKGNLPCNGSVMRIPLNGGKPELVAWGFRNPFGLAFSPDGNLYVSDNGYDDRGSRPVWGAGDLLWRVDTSLWFGWPDYSDGKPLTDKEFKAPGKPQPKFILQNHPNEAPKAIAQFGVHASANGFDFSSSDAFGYRGNAFVAEFGDMAPMAGKVLAPVGFKVVRVDVSNGVIEEFAINKGETNGPASLTGGHGLERPVSVRFDKKTNALYVVDFGIIRMSEREAEPMQNTGVIWKISRL